MSKFNINLHETIYSLSDALDLVGVTQLQHGKRVAYMAAECGKALSWPVEQVDQLFQAGILHDCGVSNTSVHQKLTQFQWEDEKGHCEVGAKLLKSVPLLAHLSDVILHHHTHWSDLQALDLSEADKLNANCIYMVDRVDVLTLVCRMKEPDILMSIDEIRGKILDKRGDWFHPDLVDAFMTISESEAFWFSLEREHVSGYVSTWVDHDYTREIDFQDLKSIVRLFSYVVDAKSSFTCEHSEGVASLSRLLGELSQLSEKSCDAIEVAGLLHDIGKLRVPDTILEKPGKLTDKEFQTMKRHSFDTYNILKQIKGFEEIAQWASDHHERIDGGGYPYHKAKNRLSIEARIIAVADVFQSLAQKRPYRDALPANEILDILLEQAESGHLDANLVKIVEQNLEICCDAALLQGKFVSN